ncbi:MAG: hypothetical protein WAK31_04120 [Chthoniobacterales bacterium]
MNITIEKQTVITRGETRPEVVPHIMDFFEARHPLMLTSREARSLKKITGRPVKGNRRRETFDASANLLDEALYWFISAPALGYLVYVVLGL